MLFQIRTCKQNLGNQVDIVYYLGKNVVYSYEALHMDILKLIGSSEQKCFAFSLWTKSKDKSLTLGYYGFLFLLLVSHIEMDFLL